MALTEAEEQSSLEQEALEFLLEAEQREKEELQAALTVTKRKGKPFHEVIYHIYYTTVPLSTCSCVLLIGSRETETPKGGRHQDSDVLNCRALHGIPWTEGYYCGS